MPTSYPSDRGQDAGLCARCRHARAVFSDRGGEFLLCDQSSRDPALPRYPRLPRLECHAFEDKAGEGAGRDT